ncbi:MAG: HD domain-containing protein [Candidatus Hodarchaeales archaeon]
MDFFLNLIAMKRLLRQGWVRAGIPICSIESIADHSWSVAVLSYILVSLENNIRENKGLNKLSIESTILSGLLHDINESEYFDIDKSIDAFLENDLSSEIRKNLEEGSIKAIVSKLPDVTKKSFSQILNDHESEEYQLVRAADLIDLLLQTENYAKKRWLDEYQEKEFKEHSLKELKELSLKFYSVKQLLEDLKINV